MTKSLWHDGARAEMHRRLSLVRAETMARWGSMTAAEMIAHVNAGMKLGLGELPSRERKTFLRWWPFKHLFVYWMPFPRNVKAPHELIRRDVAPAEFEARVAALRADMEKFAAQARDREYPVHPVFGKLTGEAWAALGWRHLDHHLRQFGV